MFDANCIVLSKDGMYVRKRYESNGMYKLNVIYEISSFAYMVFTFDVWHARLGHVNYKSMRSMSNLSLIPKINCFDLKKCAICVKSKIAKKSF